MIAAATDTAGVRGLKLPYKDGLASELFTIL